MPRYRDSVTGIVVNVPADKGARLTGYGLVADEVKESEAKPKPAARAPRAKSE